MDYKLACELFNYDECSGALSAKSIEYVHIYWDADSGTVPYYKVRVRQEIYLAHRVIWLLKTVDWPSNLVDHIDQNTANNKWSNLRRTTYSGNALNTKATGVSWHKNRKYWIAQITYKKKQYHLGCYYDKEEALKVVAKKRAELIQNESLSTV